MTTSVENWRFTVIVVNLISKGCVNTVEKNLKSVVGVLKPPAWS